MKKEKKILFIGSAALCAASAAILAFFIVNQSRLSLSYVVLIVFTILSYILNGVSFYLVYRQNVRQKELEREMSCYVDRVVLAVRENSPELLEEVKCLPTDRLRDDAVLQSMLSDHISSVNTALMVTSIVVALVTIAIPLMNYGLVTRDQMELLDSQVNGKIMEIDSRMNEKLDEADQRIMDFDAKTVAMQQSTRHLETVVKLSGQTGQDKINTLLDYLESCPEDAEMRNLLMTGYYEVKDYSGTIEQANLIINNEDSTESELIAAYRNRANAEYCIGNYEQAIADYETYLADGKDDAGVKEKLAGTLDILGEYEQAAKIRESMTAEAAQATP